MKPFHSPGGKSAVLGNHPSRPVMFRSCLVGCSPMPKYSEARFEENFPGADLSPDEIEFAFAMEHYMRLNRRPFPTWHEVLRVALQLGYRKPPSRITLDRPASE